MTKRKLAFFWSFLVSVRFASFSTSLVSEPFVRLELTTYSLQVFRLGPVPISTPPTEHIFTWSHLSGSNWRPTHYKWVALPTELKWRMWFSSLLQILWLLMQQLTCDKWFKWVPPHFHLSNWAKMAYVIFFPASNFVASYAATHLWQVVQMGPSPFSPLQLS